MYHSLAWLKKQQPERKSIRKALALMAAHSFKPQQELLLSPKIKLHLQTINPAKAIVGCACFRTQDCRPVHPMLWLLPSVRMHYSGFFSVNILSNLVSLWAISFKPLVCWDFLARMLLSRPCLKQHAVFTRTPRWSMNVLTAMRSADSREHSLPLETALFPSLPPDKFVWWVNDAFVNHGFANYSLILRDRSDALLHTGQEKVKEPRSRLINVAFTIKRHER